MTGERDGDRLDQRAAASVRTLAGVGDQDPTCVNGTPGCPGPDASAGLPCSTCFFDGGEQADG